MRTLVVSDLHLGGRLRHGVLTRSEPLSCLLAEVASVDRLVLLGDIVELMQGRSQQAMEIAEPVMRSLGASLGADREVILVPGNHDAPMVRAWVRAQGARLTASTPVHLDATPALRRFASWLSPAHVRVSYPGVWLSERVWATHGHYLDRHLLPESAYGIARGLARRPVRAARPIDYELVRRPSLTRLTNWLPWPAATLLEDFAEIARASTMPRIPKRLLHRGIAPLTAMLLGMQMQRASIPAIAHVVARLGIAAEWVVFGHVHRLGPLPGDDPRQWQAAAGWPKVVNAGSWLYEPRLVHRVTPPHPYWPGGAVLLESGRDPQAINLLGQLDANALR